MRQSTRYRVLAAFSLLTPRCNKTRFWRVLFCFFSKLMWLTGRLMMDYAYNLNVSTTFLSRPASESNSAQALRVEPRLSVVWRFNWLISCTSLVS